MPNDEPIRVELVNPPMENPWRTLGAYQEEQRRAKFQFWVAIVSMILTMGGVIATSAIAIVTIQGMA